MDGNRDSENQRSRSTCRTNGARAARRASLTSRFSTRGVQSDVKVQTAFSIAAVHRVFSSFVGEKKYLVESIGLGGIMKVHPQTKFSRLLVLWIVRNMDPWTGMVRLANGEELPVTEIDVELVLGLTRGKEIIKCGMPVSANDVARVRTALMINDSTEITLGYLEKVLVKDYGVRMTTREAIAFKIAAILYADAYYLAPKGTKAKVNQSLFRYITDAAMIEGFNWCAYVLRTLINSSRRAQEALSLGETKVTLDGCLFFWVVR